MKTLKISIVPIVLAALLASCAESPTGRRQVLLFGNAEMSQMGTTAFDEMKQKMTVSSNSNTNRYVTCVADAITTMLPAEWRGSWEVVVFEEDSANAFALPGKKIGVHTGILKVAKNQDQLGTVLGHEVGHVLAQHSAERLSLQSVASTTTQLVGVMLGEGAGKETVMGLMGLGTQYGVVLPYGRAQESEADVVGLDLMAEAGFNPQESVELWKNMSAANSGQPPEFLSTHPSHQTRISDLEDGMAKANGLYQQAKAQGRRPNCK
ncbi:Peptidase family M48 [Spongiibacter sp. IMCC21906]|jgi:predicted Zn-dependent protease|uniref:M48 family metallopeptidase n=1 Tax=Spongiibacter sp. IMCC21906 TaxID=1620392 RepID=UPI00062DEC4F|nr:M48 family metallopeptidase [Spongiibacter sp. IMCC21906]AKH70490.1 Peptidase family M48 [Spongiibacter sp. IMCC21906]